MHQYTPYKASNDITIMVQWLGQMPSKGTALRKAKGNHLSILSKQLMKSIRENGVSGSSSSNGAAPGRGGTRASHVVILQNPYDGFLRIATWNVRSLQQSEKLENLKREMTRHRINIAGITELRWRDKGDIWTDDYRMIYSVGQESQRGVAIMHDRKTAQCIKQMECVSYRLMMVKLSICV